MLRPGFFSSEQVLNCSMPARLLFQGLWCLADKEGRLEDRPKQIKLLILPMDRVDVDKLLSELAAAELIVRYEAAGQRCIWLPKFIENQRIHPHEATSLLPEPPKNSLTFPDVITCPDISGRLKKEVIQDPIPDPENKNPDHIEPEVVTPTDLVEAWNEVCPPAGLPAVAELTPKRKIKALERIREHPNPAYWQQIFANIPTSRLLRGLVKGNGHDNWRANFDWLIEKPENSVKVYEGNYNGG